MPRHSNGVTGLLREAGSERLRFAASTETRVPVKNCLYLKKNYETMKGIVVFTSTLRGVLHEA